MKERESILQIASDLREGSISTQEAKSQLNILLKNTNSCDTLNAPSLKERIDFAHDLIKRGDLSIPISLILAITYWMQAQMINLNR